MSQLRVRNFVFTLNNHTAAERALLQASVTGQEPYASFIVWNHELAPTTGTPHLQGYIELFKQLRLNTLKRKFGIHRIHLEERRGSQQQAITYSTKLDSRDHAYAGPVQFGRRKRLNARLGSAIDQVMAKTPMREVASNHPETFVRSFRDLQALAASIVTPRNWAMEIEIYVGPTGSGKSFHAYARFPEAYTVEWPEKRGVWWWNGYDGQNEIILDEFRCQVPYSKILRLFDRYGFKVQTKGGVHDFVSKKIIITTNIHPNNWYRGVHNKTHLARRLHDFANVYVFILPLPMTPAGLPNPTMRQIHVRGHPNAPCSMGATVGPQPLPPPVAPPSPVLRPFPTGRIPIPELIDEDDII